jgi:hypothetical protein
MTIEEQIIQKTEKLNYMKELHMSMAMEYGSELSAGDMLRQEEELENEVELLEIELKKLNENRKNNN